MALVIGGGTTGATGNAVASATGTAVIAAGSFGGSTVEIVVEKDLSEKAPVYTFMGPGAVFLDVPGATVTATIVGGDGTASIDVVIG